MGFDYQRYLASREWALLKEQVRERCGNECERCGGPYESTHHLTYERIGHELLEDLQAVCNPCHEFLSGKRSDDPARELVFVHIWEIGAVIMVPKAQLLNVGNCLYYEVRDASGWKGRPTFEEREPEPEPGPTPPMSVGNW